MADRIRIHFDANVDPASAVALRRAGIDVTLANEVGLRTASDEEHISFARRERRVIMTHDTDYLAFGRSSIDHWGIVFSPKDQRTIGQMVDYLLLLTEVTTAEEMRGRIEYM